jgi:NADH-quinone oxidoreductase subunit J
MISLAVLYAVQDAPFLFVLMLVGVDASDSVVETIKGQRFLSVVFGLILGVVLVVGIAQISLGTVTGLDDANAPGNIPAIADLLFSKYVFAFEVTSALLITAAMGAMVLAHRERLQPKPSQADLAARRMQEYAVSGRHPGPLPTPGVFARHNAVDTPALLPDGTASEASVSRVLAARGTVRSAPAMADDIAGIEQQLGPVSHAGRDQTAAATTEEEAPATTNRDQEAHR